MRERLIELLENMDGIDHMDAREAGVDWYDIADYLLNNGVIVLPCKVEDTVWAIRYGEETDYIVVPMIILEIHIYEHGVFFVPSENIRAFRLKDFGTQVFLTKEEAEEALKRLQGNE